MYPYLKCNIKKTCVKKSIIEITNLIVIITNLIFNTTIYNDIDKQKI